MLRILLFALGALYLSFAGVCVWLLIRRRAPLWLLVPAVGAVIITAASLALRSIRPYGLILLLGFFPFVSSGKSGKRP